jgi:hypothetical protein
MATMSSRSSLSATTEQKAALTELARSEPRGEADRARAILLTLSGWTSPEVPESFGVTVDSVRHWRQWFAEGGVEALRSTLAPGPSAEKGERALEVAIGARAFDVLLVLAEARGELVTKHEILSPVWPNMTVEENAPSARVGRGGWLT